MVCENVKVFICII